MELKDRADKFLVEFVALCERHSVTITTGGEKPMIIFVDPQTVQKYLEWWHEEGVVGESKDFTDFLP